jgi:hypothetical protein
MSGARQSILRRWDGAAERTFGTYSRGRDVLDRAGVGTVLHGRIRLRKYWKERDLQHLLMEISPNSHVGYSSLSADET